MEHPYLRNAFKTFLFHLYAHIAPSPKLGGSTIDGSQCWLQIRIQETFSTCIQCVALRPGLLVSRNAKPQAHPDSLNQNWHCEDPLDNLHTHWSLRYAVQYHAKGQENLHFWRFWFICSWEEPRHHFKKKHFQSSVGQSRLWGQVWQPMA